MSRPRVMTWFEALSRAQQWATALLFFGGLVWGGLTIGWAFWVYVVDTRVRYHLNPVVDMLEFSMKQSGQWEPYIEEKSKRDRDRRLLEPSQVRAQTHPFTPIIEN